MALYTIGDTHLSLGSDKPMDVFGGAWEGYVEKLAQGLSVLRPEDTLVIAGDISWGMSLEESEADFAWLDALPGRKILMKGNHDYWWNTAAKMTRFFAEKGFKECGLPVYLTTNFCVPDLPSREYRVIYTPSSNIIRAPCPGSSIDFIIRPIISKT